MPNVTKAIIVKTMCLENYGDADKPHWKRKSGQTVWVANVQGEEASLNTADFAGLIQDAAPELETRDSAMFIEMVSEVDLLDLTEAERRAAIDTKDPRIDSDDFFAAISRNRAGVETFRMS
jgi:hypothetical protein